VSEAGGRQPSKLGSRRHSMIQLRTGDQYILWYGLMPTAIGRRDRASRYMVVRRQQPLIRAWVRRLAQTPPRSSFLVQLRIGSSTMILRALLCISLFLVAALPAEAAQRQRAEGLFGTKIWRNSVPRPPRSVPRVARPPAASVRSQPQSAATGQPSATLSTPQDKPNTIPPGRNSPSTQTLQPPAGAGPALPGPAMSQPATISSDTGFTPVQGFE